jgi:hypothetical protein
VKAVLAQRGAMKALLRPPMDLPTQSQQARVTAALQSFER